MRLPTTAMTPREQRSVAIHEAAHAVAAVRQGVPIVSASIGQGHDRGRATIGRVVVGGGEGNEMGFAVIARTATLAQFVVADAETVRQGAALDNDDIDRSIDVYLRKTMPNPNDRDRAVVRDVVDQHAQRIVDQDWPCIDALAAALVARGELGADEILKIVEDETARMLPVLRNAQRGDRMLCNLATSTASTSSSGSAEQIRATAYHEAAHAVVAIRVGAALTAVTIKPSLARGGAVAGYVEIARSTQPYNYAVIAAAGEAASRRLIDVKKAIAAAELDRSDIDVAIARWYHEKFGSAPIRREMVETNIRIGAIAKDLVDENWSLIERVAIELMVRETMSGDDVKRIIEEADGTASRTLSVATRRLPDTLPLQTRLQPIGAGAIDVEARTVQIIFTTGATVRRRKYTGWDTAVPFDETLVVSREAIDLTRLNAGAPVLDSHATYTTFSQVGVVERAWIEGKEGRATVRFPKAGIDAAADRMFGLVADRVIRNISCGYRIDQVRIVEAAGKGQVEQHIVERWTPHEISFVTVGADPGAQVRSADGLAKYPVMFGGASARGIGAAEAARIRSSMMEQQRAAITK
ncbi:MAG: hypothetical protein E5Y79_16090 [Mesorhizobium sp.]|uniref:hypothetical protein n=1 Tax=Mesorhizobium sp. TaxID=1871066 RepID=UPI001212018D|nr:hypothetical protein [Mesorhizobium sp.]TIL59255.1 MAG: hypothetical protein E5Y79_16090 [Mesorhizobium sp.]